MRKVTCASCGRPYDYDSDDFCPKCGSYNPLLLRCLDDVSDTAKQGMKDAGQTVAPLRRVVEELYKGRI